MTDPIEQIIERAEKKKPFTVSISGRLIERDRSDGSTTHEYSVTSGSVTYVKESLQCDASELSTEMADIRARISSELRRLGIRHDMEMGDIYINPSTKIEKEKMVLTDSQFKDMTYQILDAASILGLSEIKVRERLGTIRMQDGYHYTTLVSEGEKLDISEDQIRARMMKAQNYEVIPDKLESPPGMLFDPAEFSSPQNSASEIDGLRPDGSRKRYRPRK